MRPPKTFLRLTITTVLIASLLPATAQAQGMWSLGRSLADLSAADKTAMEGARREVLEKLTPGAVSEWKDEKTGHLGEAQLLRVYEMNGMTCGEVKQVLKNPKVQQYMFAFCRTGDGTWLAAY